MITNTGWTRQQLLVAFSLYCQIPFGRLHSRNPDIIDAAERIGRTPSALAMKLTNIASLDPAITSTGRKGLKGASASDRAMWEEMQADWGKFAVEMQQAADSLDISGERSAAIDEFERPEESEDYTGRNRISEAAIRIGQGFFRRAVLSAYEYRCCISGLAVPELLVAGHIVPWRIDAKNRLNPRNGLCLSMLHDKAFDVGIITVAEDMTVRVSKKYKEKADPFFNLALSAYDGKPIVMPGKFRPHPEFLDYHRNEVFERSKNRIGL